MPGTIQSPMDSVKCGLASKPLSTQLVSYKRDALKREVSLLSALLPTKKRTQWSLYTFVPSFLLLTLHCL